MAIANTTSWESASSSLCSQHNRKKPVVVFFYPFLSFFAFESEQEGGRPPGESHRKKGQQLFSFFFSEWLVKCAALFCVRESREKKTTALSPPPLLFSLKAHKVFNFFYSPVTNKGQHPLTILFVFGKNTKAGTRERERETVCAINKTTRTTEQIPNRR